MVSGGGVRRRPAGSVVRDSTLVSVRTFANVIRGADGVFDDFASVQTHALVDAEPAAGPARIPVLVFSHGYTGVPGAYTALLEDFWPATASRS